MIAVFPVPVFCLENVSSFYHHIYTT